MGSAVGIEAVWESQALPFVGSCRIELFQVHGVRGFLVGESLGL